MKTFSNSFGLGLLLSFSIVEQRALSLFISCMCEYKAGRHDIKISGLPEPRCAILSDCIAFDARGQDFVSQSFPFLPRCQHQKRKILRESRRYHHNCATTTESDAELLHRIGDFASRTSELPELEGTKTRIKKNVKREMEKS